MDTALWLCPSPSTATLKWLSSLPILMQESFWWWQCSDRYIISLFPHLHTPFSPSLIILAASVDVKHHVYLLSFLGSPHSHISGHQFQLSVEPPLPSLPPLLLSLLLSTQEEKQRWPKGFVLTWGTRRIPNSKHWFTTSFWRKVPESHARSVDVPMSPEERSCLEGSVVNQEALTEVT